MTSSFVKGPRFVTKSNHGDHASSYRAQVSFHHPFTIRQQHDPEAIDKNVSETIIKKFFQKYIAIAAADTFRRTSFLGFGSTRGNA
jgi:hypothetical protein